MAVLPIISAPDPRLKLTCEPVAKVDKEIARLMADMLETIYHVPGIGLAAPQVGRAIRVIVADIGREKDDRQPYLMANPELLWASDEVWEYEEGCLSLPGEYALLSRPEKIRVAYLDKKNQPQELEAEGILATCVLHEMDHLEGILFVDHLSKLKRDLILRRLVKQRKQKAAVNA